MKVSRVALATGITIEYAEHGDADGSPVALLHGLADSWRAFEPVLPHLPGSIRAIAWTQRGHGGSDRPPSGYRIGELAADVAAFLDALGVARAVLVGGSSGGVIAQRVAMDHPARVAGLVLLASPVTLARNDRARALFDTTFATLADPVDPAFVRAFAVGVSSAAVPDDFLETMIAENMRVPAHVWRGFNRALIEDDHTDRLGEIAAPTLVISGAHDDLVASDQRLLGSAIPGARLVTYPDAGHMLYWERPERVAADIVSFVRAAGLEGRS